MSSLFSALNVAVLGLQAQSASIGNISDNLANSETTGYKSIGTSFESLVTQSDASNNNPGGVSATPKYQNDVQGTIATTSTVSNMAISGAGFFAVETASQTATGSTELTGDVYYTRQGDFTMDKDGYLVNGSGFYLLGYTIDSATGLVNSSSADAIQISSLLDNPVDTSSVTYAANLPAGATAGAYTSTASTIQVYDALGNTHEMSLTWEKTGTNAWTVNVTVEDGLGSGTNYTASVDVTFNGTTNIGTIASLATGAGYTVNASPDAGINFDLTFPGAGTQTIDLSFGTLNAASGVTQYASTGSSDTVSVASFQQNGLSAGSYSSISINDSGVVSINYTNGSTRQIFQIPIVRFNSPNNLQRVSGGAYQATLASGVANFYLAGLNGAGKVNSSSLEASNVDIATEFTTLIQSQQIYSANAKVVTTVNQMLNTIEQAVQ